MFALQWTKPRFRATLQCNVDPDAGRRLLFARRNPPPSSETIPWTCICAARRTWQPSSAHQIDATAHVTDLRKAEDLARLAKEASDIDILVNNAGDIPGGSIDKIDEATWRHAWELKVFGYVNLTRLIYAQMKARGGGVIVNDIGAAGEKFDANYICGSAGNAALMAFTRALGGKSLADNIRVVGINPGPVGTDRHVTLLKTRARHQLGDENRYKEFQKGMPLGRPAHAREIGDLMAFLASDRSGYTSGVIFTVDGGISAGWG